jgi:hypothetical protein
MTTETKRGRGKQVSATVAPELFAALEDYAWENRRQRTDVVRQAVEEFAERNGIGLKREPNKVIISNDPSIYSPEEIETAAIREGEEQDNEVHHEA